MSNKFETAVGLVREHLDSHHYCYDRRRGYLRCYRLLGEYLLDKKESYSKPLTEQWLDSIALCDSTRKLYRMALWKLDEAYHQKVISNTNTKNLAQQQRALLAPWCRCELDVFMSAISDEYNSSFPYTIKTSVVRFLNYLANIGVTKVEDISHKIIANYYCDDMHDHGKLKNLHIGCIRKFLRFLSEGGRIQMSIPLTLDKPALSRLVFIKSLPVDKQAEFAAISGDSSVKADEYYRKTLKLGALVEHHRYSKTARNVFPKAWKELFIFLEANLLGYSKEIALAWAGQMRYYTVQWRSFRRALMLFEQYLISGNIDPQIVYRYQPDRAEALPAWCKADYEAFMAKKLQELNAESSLDMYRSSCLRLLEYLSRTGASSWAELTPEILKEFHRQDVHSTSEGKNAYSCRIRKFLEYLGDIGRISSTLFMAMPSESAPRTNIIQTLDEHSIANLYKYRDGTEDAYGLRHTAMILLGLRMGLPPSDITKLKFSDISWEQETLSIQQQKTDKFLRLPMPVEVGNALYRYITQGRPDSESEFVFLAHKAPYKRLHRSACLNALNKALPENTHGFRVTRKTFASRMLVNNVSAGRIAETLGHADDSTVMQYLSTDGERMRMCALGLSEIPVGGGILS
jgi:site-specific recombinase XerD